MSKNAAAYGLESFVRDEITRASPIQKRLRAETERMSRSYMLSTPDQVALLAWLVRLIGARRVLELGTFTGHSALSMALALPDDGQLVTCDLGGPHLNVAQRFWHEAGLADRISLRLGDAGKTLEALLAEGQANSFDLVFIDANQGPAYDAYFEACLRLVRFGGVIAFENMLWSGAVANPRTNDVVTEAIRALNFKLRDDPRVDISLLTIGDGLMLVRRRDSIPPDDARSR